jgi:hypothetical protein
METISSEATGGFWSNWVVPVAPADAYVLSKTFILRTVPVAPLSFVHPVGVATSLDVDAFTETVATTLAPAVTRVCDGATTLFPVPPVI